MKAALFLVLAVCLVASAYGRKPYSPPKDPRAPCGIPYVETDCRVAAFSYAEQIGVGSCYVSSKARCEAGAASFSSVVKDILKDFEPCEDGDYTAAARAIAVAAVKTFAQAVTKVSCNGGGYQKVCSKAKARAEAEACSLAAAIASVLVINDDAKCGAAAVAIVNAFVKVVSKAKTYHCTKLAGPEVFVDVETSAAIAVQKAVATAIARCWVDCDKKVVADAHASGATGQFGLVSGDSSIVFGDGSLGNYGP